MPNSLSTPSIPARKRRYEGSPADERQDKRSAKKRGMSVKAYEATSEDKRQDKAGQKRMDKKGAGKGADGGLRHAFREAFSGKPPTAASSVNDGLRIRRPKGAGRGR